MADIQISDLPGRTTPAGTDLMHVEASGADYKAELSALVNAVTDAAPTEDSPAPVSSGGMFDALAGIDSDIDNLETSKQDVLTFDNTPTANSNNPVKSGGIKTALDNALDYSTTETNTGAKWIDGKPIYRKVVECGTLPNNTTKTVNVNIANMGDVVNLRGFATSNTGSTITLPYIYDASTYIEFYFSKTNLNVIIKSSFNASSYYTTSYTILEYTKTTD